MTESKYVSARLELSARRRSGWQQAFGIETATLRHTDGVVTQAFARVFPSDLVRLDRLTEAFAERRRTGAETVLVSRHADPYMEVEVQAHFDRPPEEPQRELTEHLYPVSARARAATRVGLVIEIALHRDECVRYPGQAFPSSCCNAAEYLVRTPLAPARRAMPLLALVFASLDVSERRIRANLGYLAHRRLFDDGRPPIEFGLPVANRDGGSQVVTVYSVSTIGPWGPEPDGGVIPTRVEGEE